MKHLINKKVLITTTAFFYAPDGVLYRSVWGTLKGVHQAKDVFGFTPSARHTNWFIEVGKVVITGCQVNYLIECENKPNTENAKGWDTHEAKPNVYERPTGIYITD